MSRFAALAVLLVTCLLAGTPGPSAQPDKGRDASGLPFAIGNREEPELNQLQAFAKDFCVAMRRLHGEKGGNALRPYFDPRYLKKHGLLDRDLSVNTAAVVPIFAIDVADDMRTVLCVVGTKANPKDKESVKEAILLRVTVHEGKLYLMPHKAPDPKSGTFTPWILRTKL